MIAHQWDHGKRPCSGNPHCRGCFLGCMPWRAHRVAGILAQAWFQAPRWNWPARSPSRSQRARFAPRLVWVLENQVQLEPPQLLRGRLDIADLARRYNQMKMMYSLIFPPFYPRWEMEKQFVGLTFSNLAPFVSKWKITFDSHTLIKTNIFTN